MTMNICICLVYHITWNHSWQELQKYFQYFLQFNLKYITYWITAGQETCVLLFFFFPILLVWALLFIFLQEKVEKNKIHLKALSSEYAKYLQEKLKNKQQFSPPGCNKADQHILQVFRIWQISKRNRWWKILAQLFTYRSETDLLSTLLL